MARKKRDTIEYKPLAELLQSFHEENPRIHGDDIPKLAMSLLMAGWCELPSYNTENRKLIGGHGRIGACEYLIQQPKAWFDLQWQEFCAANPGAEMKHRDRFTSQYWLKVPVRVNALDETLHKAMMVRLNNEKQRGEIDAKIRTRILARLPAAQADLAIPDPARRAKLLEGVQQRLAEQAPQRAAEQAAEVELATQTRTTIADFAPMLEDMPPIDLDEDGAAMTEEYTPDESADPEPDVKEGGLNLNADPKPNEKRVVTFPLAVILTERKYQQYMAWKNDNRIVDDNLALMRGHVVFKEVKEESNDSVSA